MIRKYKHSLFKNTEKVFSCAGSQEIPAYVLDFKPDGGVQLKQKGTKPIYKLIQANKVNCDLQSVLEHCVHQNQLAITNQSDVESAIADFTQFSSYADIFTGVKHLGQIWSEMPVEVREQFNSSKASFISSIASDDFNVKLSKGYSAYYDSISHRLDKVKPAPPEVIVPEVSVPEVKVPDVKAPDVKAPDVKAPDVVI